MLTCCLFQCSKVSKCADKLVELPPTKSEPERVVFCRYKARGINSLAAAANEIECEQIITLQNERWTSYVWRRGSVPLRWSQTVKPNGVGTAIAIEGDRTFCGSRRSALLVMHYVLQVAL
jgi:hypothetical protein